MHIYEPKQLLNFPSHTFINSTLNIKYIFTKFQMFLRHGIKMNWADCRINGIVFILVRVIVDLFNTA